MAVRHGALDELGRVPGAGGARPLEWADRGLELCRNVRPQPRSAFQAGEPICHAGDPGLGMMTVISGTVRSSVTTARGKEMILADLAAGELFGEIAVLDGRPRSADATALTTCEVLVLERTEVRS